ncbi:phosphotransferase [Actinoplanes sp. NPDC051346]|uniref:phosphotransferase family protein n=1 Tax=Actinoplanes sp. NPDC051346 TaxID=3155048 RepID=UPI0034196D3D
MVERLAGGTHAVTHLLETEQPASQLVLRRYPPGDTAAGREAEILKALDGLEGWAPRLVDSDALGKRFGEPAVLITRLAGHADITSVPPHDAAEQLGRALARVHAVPLDRFGGLRDGMLAASSPDPGRAPGAAVLASGLERLRAEESVLTHFDYWSGNVLWQRETITGIVDWSGASRAPRGLDVSWCRLDLVLLHGPTAAEIFLAAYQRAARQVVANLALWDLFALTNSHHTVEGWLPNYQSLGRTDLTATDLRARHTAWTSELLEHRRER